MCAATLQIADYSRCPLAKEALMYPGPYPWLVSLQPLE